MRQAEGKLIVCGSPAKQGRRITFNFWTPPEECHVRAYDCTLVRSLWLPSTNRRKLQVDAARAEVLHRRAVIAGREVDEVGLRWDVVEVHGRAQAGGLQVERVDHLRELTNG